MMNTKKNLILRFIIQLLLVSTILFSCGMDNMHSIKPSLDFSEIMKHENVDDISLTIYYINPFILTLFPWSVDNLINACEGQKIVINGSDLEEHINLFKQISNDDLIPVKTKSYLNARFYYVLESKKNGKLFDVAMWGGDDKSIFFNGVEVKGKDIFCDIVMPFLPEDAKREFKTYLNRGNTE